MAQEGAGRIEQVRTLVDAGAAPKSALEKAYAEIEDNRDEETLRRTLYAHVTADQIPTYQTSDMLAAAERRVARIKARVEQHRALVAEGLFARNTLDPLLQELEVREETLRLAQSRARFFDELAEMARREQELAQLEESSAPRPARERFDGMGTFTRDDLRSVVLAFEKEFAKPLPVSASGDTPFHRAMGFDHRGRVDVALNPDAPEGAWLRKFLEDQRIPFYAFREAVPGAASGAHIHIGPPSLRLRVAD